MGTEPGGLGSGGAVGVAAFFPPRHSRSGGDLCPRRALLIIGYVLNSGQRSPSELEIPEK